MRTNDESQHKCSNCGKLRSKCFWTAQDTVICVDCARTPGPWSVAPNHCCVFTDASDRGRGVAHCGMEARAQVEQAANAMLIALAPELLDALDEAEDALSWYSGDAENIVAKNALVIVRNVLAKAGREVTR